MSLLSQAKQSECGMYLGCSEISATGNKIRLETPETKMLRVALLSQAKQSERGIAQLSSCIAGLIVLIKWYVRKEGSTTS